MGQFVSDDIHTVPILINVSSKICLIQGPYVPSKMISPHHISIEWQSEYTRKKKKQKVGSNALQDLKE